MSYWMRSTSIKSLPSRSMVEKSSQSSLFAPCQPGVALRDLCNASHFQKTSLGEGTDSL